MLDITAIANFSRVKMHIWIMHILCDILHNVMAFLILQYMCLYM